MGKKTSRRREGRAKLRADPRLGCRDAAESGSVGTWSMVGSGGAVKRCRGGVCLWSFLGAVERLSNLVTSIVSVQAGCIPLRSGEDDLRGHSDAEGFPLLFLEKEGKDQKVRCSDTGQRS